MIIRNVNNHLTVYALYCEKFGYFGDTFKELQNIRKEEEEEMKMKLNQIIEAIKAQGGRNVEEIDKIQFAFYNWIIEQKKTFKNWPEAWNEFKRRK